MPKEVRAALGIGPGDAIVYEIDGALATIRRVEPFDAEFHRPLSATLDEWATNADDEAFRDLSGLAGRGGSLPLQRPGGRETKAGPRPHRVCVQRCGPFRARDDNHRDACAVAGRHGGTISPRDKSRLVSERRKHLSW